MATFRAQITLLQEARAMRTARMHRVAMAMTLYVVLSSAPGGAYMSSIAENAHRRNRVLCQRRAKYLALLASLINYQFVFEAELLVLNPPLRTVYVRPKWATNSMPPL